MASRIKERQSGLWGTPCRPFFIVLEAIVLTVSLTTQLSAQTQTVKGNLYSETVEVAGRTLTLVGAGLRERWWFDIYTMGAYVESHTCNPQILISVDEVKFLRIDLLRDVEARSMARALEDAFEKNLPAEGRPSVRFQINTALGYFKKDLEKGDSMELTYVPSVGTAIIQNSEQQGVTIPGKGFADVLWSSYFSSSTCCSGLKKRIFAQCSQ